MDTTLDLGKLTPTEVIDGVLACRETAHNAAVRELELAVAWALLHPAPADEWPAHWGDPTFEEHLVPLAGVGAPLVAEFAPAELAAALGISLDAGKELIGDGLELTYRLPRLKQFVVLGVVPVWVARAISRETHDLSLDAVAFADRLICAAPDKVRMVNAAKLVNEARLYFDPDRAVADEEAELKRRGVWMRHRGNPATTDVVMTLDTLDAELFDQTISRIAHELGSLGDTDGLEIRRARAVGILADPQHALDLLSGINPVDGVMTSRASGNINLYVHLTPDDLESGTTGGASIEKLGAATTHLIQNWLARHTAASGTVTVRPVLDLADDTGVDQHDPPAAMRELCFLRDAHCVYPGCRRDSRCCDLDHITPYVPMDEGGPPGQTRASNLAPLCRPHHRIKTFTGSGYKPLDDGTYAWTATTGHEFVVDAISRRPPERRS